MNCVQIAAKNNGGYTVGFRKMPSAEKFEGGISLTSRRRFLVHGLVSVAVACGGLRVAKHYAVPKLLALDSDSARRVGEWCLEKFPSECDPSLLETEFGTVFAERDVSTRTEHIDSLDADFRAAVDHDLRHGRTVYIGGWVVANTEARLCAYLALS